MKRFNTRQKIINAALLVAAKEGFTKATTEKIAKVAGVSEGIIYHYFKTKYDLCINMIKEHSEQFREMLKKEIGGYRTARGKLDKLIDFHFQYFTGKGNIFRAIFGKSGDTPIMMGQILRVAIIPYIKIIEDIIKQGVKEGEFTNLNPGITSSCLLGMMQNVIIRLYFSFARFSVKDAKDEIKKLFFRGIST